MMVLETLLDIKLALLYSSVDRADLLLNRADIFLHWIQCNQWQSVPCIILARRSSLRGWGSYRYLNLDWRRLRRFIVTFEPQPGIRLHESLTAKGVLNLHHRLARDIYPKLNNEPGVQVSKKEPGRVLVSHL
jgi:hypothetical protein